MTLFIAIFTLLRQSGTKPANISEVCLYRSVVSPICLNLYFSTLFCKSFCFLVCLCHLRHHCHLYCTIPINPVLSPSLTSSLTLRLSYSAWALAFGSQIVPSSLGRSSCHSMIVLMDDPSKILDSHLLDLFSSYRFDLYSSHPFPHLALGSYYQELLDL